MRAAAHLAELAAGGQADDRRPARPLPSLFFSPPSADSHTAGPFKGRQRWALSAR